jgi:hypothetical protein
MEKNNMTNRIALEFAINTIESNVTDSTEKEMVIRKLNSMIKSLDNKTKRAKERTEEKRGSQIEEVMNILTNSETEEGLTLEEILKQCTNAEMTSTQKVQGVMRTLVSTNKVEKEKIGKRMHYRLIKTETTETTIETADDDITEEE